MDPSVSLALAPHVQKKERFFILLYFIKDMYMNDAILYRLLFIYFLYKKQKWMI